MFRIKNSLFSRAKETARFWLEQENIDQLQWVKDILNRLSVDQKSEISICLLDTGVNNGHGLIAPVLPDENLHSVQPEWGNNDSQGHGTLMSGVTIYGDLQKVLESQSAVNIHHRLESVKLIPKPGRDNERELYGYLTQQGISRAEIKNPKYKRIICMAVTSKDSLNKGKPSSWSGKTFEAIADVLTLHVGYLLV